MNKRELETAQDEKLEIELEEGKGEGEEEEERIQNLRSKATEHLLREEYSDSIQTYSQIISLCQDRISKNNPDGPQLSKLQKTLCLAFSNRAEAQARQSELSKALRDCDEALSIEKSHFKTLLCKGKILLGLNRYGMALDCFKLANLDPQGCEQSGLVNGLLEKCKKLESLSRTGSFDVSDWVLSGFKGRVPELAEYIGPVEIKKSEISGRGLFATKNIESGTLLLVTKAIAVDRAIMPQGSGETAHLVIWKNLIDKVVETAQKCDFVRFLISNLSTGEDEGSLGIPEIAIFRSGGDLRGGCLCKELDTGNILSILDTNSILEDAVSSKILGKNSGYQGVGLWALASFINHSCEPNVRRLHMGDYVIVHTARDVKAGEELSFAYFDVLSPLNERVKMAEEWGFFCRCKRCEFEGNLWCKQEMKDLEVVLGKGHVEVMGNVVCGLEEGIRRWVVRGKGKGYLRASFWEAYSSLYGSDKAMRKWGRKVPSVESLVDSMADSVGSDERFLRVFVEGVKKSGINGGIMEMEKVMRLGRGIYGKVMKRQALRTLVHFGGNQD